jgi:hypothetical protein
MYGIWLLNVCFCDFMFRKTMSLLPFTSFDTMLEPFEPLWSVETFDPSALNRFNTYLPRTMRRSLRRMNREMGKMLSSVKEDDKSFQVPKATVFFKLILLFYGFFPSGDG